MQEAEILSSNYTLHAEVSRENVRLWRTRFPKQMHVFIMPEYQAYGCTKQNPS